MIDDTRTRGQRRESVERPPAGRPGTEGHAAQRCVVLKAVPGKQYVQFASDHSDRTHRTERDSATGETP